MRPNLVGPLHTGPALPVLYFTLLVLFGAFFAMQLLVAILSSKFAQLSAQVRGP